VDLGAHAAHRLGLPLILTRRVASPIRRNVLSRRKYSRANIAAVIAISETVKRVMAESGYPPEDIHVVQTGLDLAAVRCVEPDSAFRAQYGPRIAGGIGRLSRKKNWQMSIRVAASIAESVPDLRWVLIGDGPERRRLERLAARLGVPDRIFFLGFREEAGRLMRNFDVLFFPSLMEGASVTVREAMAMGVPVVAVNAEGTVESLDGHGWIVTPGDIEGGRRAVQEALDDPGKRTAAIDGARASAEARFSIDKTVEGTLAVYESVLESRHNVS
jgi:glycosyltransferase involved in cell wall biosynthesis